MSGGSYPLNDRHQAMKGGHGVKSRQVRGLSVAGVQPRITNAVEAPCSVSSNGLG